MNQLSEPQIIDICNAYIARYNQPDDFGLGPFLDKNGTVYLHANESTAFDGSIALEFLTNAEFFDCRTISLKIYDELIERHPILEPRVMTSTDNGNIHNWVEIKDANGRTIQIDATPWYARLNPGHENGTNTSEQRITSGDNGLEARLDGNSSIILSLSKKENTQTITTYLTAYLPRIKDRMKRIASGIFDGKIKPEYRFLLFVDGGEFGRSQTKMTFFTQVPDSTTLSNAIYCKKYKTINELAGDNIIEIGFAPTYALGNDEFIVIPTIERGRQLAEKIGKSEYFAEVERNLERLFKLLRCAGPILPISHKQKIDVSNGNIDFVITPFERF